MDDLLAIASLFNFCPYNNCLLFHYNFSQFCVLFLVEESSTLKDALSEKEEFYLLTQHLRQVETLERLKESGVASTGAVFDIRSPYESFLKTYKTTAVIKKRISEIESTFEKETPKNTILVVGEQLLRKRTVKMLEDKIEMLYYSIIKKSSSISKFAGAKQLVHIFLFTKFNYLLLHYNYYTFRYVKTKVENQKANCV